MTAFRSKLKNLDKELGEVVSSKKEIEERYEVSVQTFNGIRQELEDSKHKVELERDQVTHQLRMAEAHIQKVLQEFETERQRYDVLEAEYQGTSEEMQLEVARLTHLMETVHQENEQLKQQTSQGEAESLQRLQVELEQAEQQKHIFSMGMDTLRSEMEELKEEHQEELEKLQFQKKQLQSEMNQMRQEDDSLRRQCEELQKQYSMLENDNVQYQELVAKMTTSIQEREQEHQQQTLMIHKQERVISALQVCDNLT